MSKTSAPVLLASSLVAGSGELLRGAHAAARALGVRLHRVYAIAPPGGGEEDAELVRHVAAAARERFARQAKRLAIPSAELGETIVRPGRPDEVILEEARRLGAGLIVLRGSDRGRRLGSTTDRVLRGAEVPVLVLRGGKFQPVRRVLFAIQQDALAEGILRHGLEVAAALSGGKALQREAISVLSHLYLDLSLTRQPERIKKDLERARQELVTLLDRAVGKGVERGFKRTVVNGYPWLEILRRARETAADLVVLGTHGERGVKRLWLGSVAADVVRSAPCSTLVIPPAARA